MQNQRPDEEHQLYVDLTDEEQQLKGRHLAAYELQARELEAEAKSKAAEFKTKLEVLKGKIAGTASEVDQKRELRPIRCRWTMRSDRWEMHRVDTGEVIQTAPVTMADRQTGLDLS